MAPIHPHAEKSGENLAECYECESGTVAGYHGNTDGRRGVFIYTTMLTSDGRKIIVI